MNKLFSDINNERYTKEEMVSILELIVSKLEINTISEMARIENKTPRGIKTSNCYRKLKIGKQTMVIKNLRDNNLPF